jgi:iron(III) transport system substrate-binding protein
MNIRLTSRAVFCISIFFLISACTKEVPAVPDVTAEMPDAPRPQTVVVYASGAATQIKQTSEAYTADTGIEVELVIDDYSKLAGKFGKPGRMPVADLFIAGSLADIASAAESDVLRPTYFETDIPPATENLRDPENVWYALSFRARVVIYNTNLVTDKELSTVSDYASLADEAWRERLCLSSSRVPGNRSLIALHIREYGVRETESIVRGWRTNFVGAFYRDDVDLLRAVAAGDCHIAIADTSVLAGFVSSDRDAPLAAHQFPNETITLVDISAAGVTRHAKNPLGAASLLQWLGSNDPNALYAASGLEFPINPAATPALATEQFIGFADDPMALAQLAFLHEDAALLAERARYP